MSFTNNNTSQKIIRKPKFNDKNSSELYYAQRNCLNYKNFGLPDYIDDKGREYKFAYEDDNIFYSSNLNNNKKRIIVNGLNEIKLFVRIPKNNYNYFEPKELKQILILKDVKDFRKTIELRLSGFFFMGRAKTGYVFMNKTL